MYSMWVIIHNTMNKSNVSFIRISISFHIWNIHIFAHHHLSCFYFHTEDLEYAFWMKHLLK